jgi:hypothetical protein
MNDQLVPISTIPTTSPTLEAFFSRQVLASAATSYTVRPTPIDRIALERLTATMPPKLKRQLSNIGNGIHFTTPPPRTPNPFVYISTTPLETQPIPSIPTALCKARPEI